MTANLGLKGIHSVHFAVRDLEKTQQFYEQRLGCIPLWRSGRKLTETSGQRSLVYGAGSARIVVSQPENSACKAARYLESHPDGVMSVSFSLTDIAHAFATLEQRGATPISEIHAQEGYKDFEITTPLGDVQFRFIETGEQTFAPGFEAIAGGTGGPIPWLGFDHLTANLRTMKPMIDWYHSVMGFEHFWDIEFHTADLEAGKHKETGSGLKSIVMWDQESGIKLASNEPRRPFFRVSQIERFVTDNRGPGIQHIALGVPTILAAVDHLTHAGLRFLNAPTTYYQRVAERLRAAGCDPSRVKESMDELAKRNVLIDGSADGYMLQIFSDELREVDAAASTSPAFYEVIQRAGDRGFGYGNFRALFEAIETQQAHRP